MNKHTKEPKREKCPRCDGQGSIWWGPHHKRRKVCPDCHGKGFIEKATPEKKYYLCCGNKTGVPDPENWIGIDVNSPADIIQDVMTINKLDEASFVLATPPCNGFTDLPWRPATGAGLDILLHCLKLCRESGCDWLLENSRFAQKYIGKSQWKRGSHYFWGTVEPLPSNPPAKGKTTGKDPLKRAELPLLFDPAPQTEKATPEYKPPRHRYRIEWPGPRGYIDDVELNLGDVVYVDGVRIKFESTSDGMYGFRRSDDGDS